MPIIKIQSEDFHLQSEVDAMRALHKNFGAMVTFTGLVRDEGWITEMVLEHYPAMTQKTMEAIGAEAIQRFDLTDCLIIHRYGALKPGEQIMMVATLAKSRKPAFEAADFLMDWLKTKAPFWKKEIGTEGDNWVDAKDADDQHAAEWDKT